MRYNKIIHTIFILGLLILSCEKHLIEEELILGYEEPGFTDKNAVIIVHDQSISYYNAKSHQVYRGLFEHINERKLDQKLHTYKAGYLGCSVSTSPSLGGPCIEHKKMGIITIPETNKIEFVHPNNFNSLGSLTLSAPPIDVEFFAGDYALVSCDADPGYLSIIDHNYEIGKSYPGFNPGKLLKVDKDIYVMNKGGIQNDSIISVYSVNLDLIINDQIKIGYNPIDFIKSKNYLAVLCEGKRTFDNGELIDQEPGYIVIYDHIEKEIKSTIQFANNELTASALFYLDYEANKVDFFRNNQLYSAGLNNLNDQTLLIKNQVKSLIIDDYVLGLSVNNTNTHSYLYRFNRTDYSLVDSLRIDCCANSLTNSILN